MSPSQPTPDLWTAYARARLELPDFGLTWPIAARTPPAVIRVLRGLIVGPSEPSVWVITADNPGGLLAHANANVASGKHLHGRIRSLGRPAVRCDGVSPDRAHREHGWACGGSLALGLDLAREFRQLALYWWDGATWWLVPASGDLPRVRLGSIDGAEPIT